MTIVSLFNPFFNSQVYFKEKTESTMRDAKELIDSGALSGSVITSAYQTKGKCRIPGRVWHSNVHENLLFTLILNKSDLEFTPMILPLLIGLGVSKFLEKEFKINSTLKWPNDVLVNDKKISGILCEFYKETFLCGIGLNCMQTNFPNDLMRPGTSIFEITNTKFKPLDVLSSLLESIKDAIANKNWKKDIENRMYKIGETIKIIEGHPKKGKCIEGILTGITPLGELILNSNNGNKKIISGEIL